MGAPANLTALQAIEHLWEATHTTGATTGAPALYVPKHLVRKIRSAGHFRNTPCYRWLAGKKCHKGDKCRCMHGSGDPCIFSHIPYVSRHTDENGVDWLAVRIPLPQAMDRFCVKMGVDIKTLDSGYPLKLGGEDCIMFSLFISCHLKCSFSPCSQFIS